MKVGLAIGESCNIKPEEQFRTSKKGIQNEAQ
jgi:hypothetical protein